MSTTPTPPSSPAPSPDPSAPSLALAGEAEVLHRVCGPRLPVELGEFRLDEVWIYYDQPLLFTARRGDATWLLAWVDRVTHPDLPPHNAGSATAPAWVPRVSDVLLATPVGEAELQDLGAGRTAPRDFWTSRPVADLMLHCDGAMHAVYALGAEAVPKEWLPSPDASYTVFRSPSP